MTALFDELVRGGPAAVYRMKGRAETLELEFKGRPPPGRGGGDKEDKRVLGKALSAFANSMGGLIVWGVDCRKNEEGVDEVVGFTPIVGLAKFASDMRDWSVEAVMPRLADVRVQALDAGDDTGFLLIDVARSERRPHRCEFGDKNYYRRTGGSSRPMEHFEIEDAFRRSSVVELQVEYEFGEGGSTISRDGALSVIALTISLKNISRLSALDPYVFVSGGLPAHMPLNRSNNITVRKKTDLLFFESERAIIHPDMTRIVAVLQLDFELYPAYRSWGLEQSQLDRVLGELIIGFGCRDTSMRTRSIRLKADDVVAAISPGPVVVGGRDLRLT